LGKYEVQANKFAAELLIDDSEIRKDLSVPELSQYFGVPEKLIKYKLCPLGAMPKNKNNAYCFCGAASNYYQGLREIISLTRTNSAMVGLKADFGSAPYAYGQFSPPSHDATNWQGIPPGDGENPLSVISVSRGPEIITIVLDNLTL
jgi:hypothetical protein